MTPRSRAPVIFRARPLPEVHWEELNSSQRGIHGFDLGTHQKARALLVGAGGIGSHVAAALIRKGFGCLDILDDDIVETKNLTRQLFGREDIGQFKATALARRLAGEALFAAEIRAAPFRFQELLADNTLSADYGFIICGVDNNPTRRAVASFGLTHRVPVIHAAVSHDGNSLYVMVQESKPNTACWGCTFPEYLNDAVYPCLPGIIDVLQLVSGLIVYAVDTLLCGRPRDWNVRYVYLDGAIPERTRTLARRPGCALCTGHNIWSA